MDNNSLQSAVHVSLVKAADLLAKELRKRLSSSEYPHADPSNRGLIPLADTVVIGPAMVNNTGGGKISVSVGNEKSPTAGAYEFGSGLHRDIDPKKYPIVAVNGKWLVIPRSRWPKYNPPPDVDPVLLQHVMHPGVEAKPYIRPSIKDVIPEIKKIVGQEVKISILRSIREIKDNATS